MAGYSQANIDALRANIARGVKELWRDGERVTFQSLDEMRTLLAEMERELAGTPRRGRAQVLAPTMNRGV